MAGTLKVDTINATTGVLATQNGMNGIAKAWVSYNAATQTVLGAFNVSSVTYQSTGAFLVNFSTPMPNANYAVSGSCGSNGNWFFNKGGSKTTTACQVVCIYPAVSYNNDTDVNAIFIGA